MSEIQRRGMTPADLFRLVIVSDAQISPDGSKVALVRTRMDEEKDEYLSNIWIASTTAGEAVQFTYGQKRDLSPRWSPDGRFLAFLSERNDDKKAQLYVIASDGGEPRRLTSQKSGAGQPVWSPDGSRIAFASRVAPEEPEEKEGDKSRPARVITQLRYKSNGEGFVYDRRRHIFVVNVGATEDEVEATQVTDGDWDDGTPVWSPDGREIAFASARHENRDYDQVSDIWAVPAHGGEPRKATQGRGPAGNPAWSPDGRLIAYAGDEHALDMGRNTKIYVVPAEGGEPRCLTAGLDRTCAPGSGSLGPVWSADSRHIYFGIEDQGTVPVYRVAVDGNGGPREVLGGQRQYSAFSLATDGSTAYISTEPLSPSEVGVAGPNGERPRQLTDFNRALREEVEFVMPERFRFERAGYQIDGWVMKPAGYELGRRYATLLNVHGGPATQYGVNFFDEFQVQAGAGYAVVFTNPRGSQGYGESFTRSVRGDWGGGDYEDVMMGLDEAIKRFDFIDRERLGILGGSYGGFMTSWTVGHTDRFKAACSERAVNNVYTLFGTSDIGSFFSETQAAATPWDDMQWFIDHSPLTYAKQIATPLLILHSEDDIRCPMEQAEQLFVVLKKLRKEVRFVRFPNENHEMSRAGKPWHRRDRFGFILDWMNTHLQPERVAEHVQETVGAD